MAEIKCPHCGQAIVISDAEYEAIAKKIAEEKDQEIEALQSQLRKAQSETSHWRHKYNGKSVLISHH